MSPLTARIRAQLKEASLRQLSAMGLLFVLMSTAMPGAIAGTLIANDKVSYGIDGESLFRADMKTSPVPSDRIILAGSEPSWLKKLKKKTRKNKPAARRSTTRSTTRSLGIRRAPTKRVKRIIVPKRTLTIRRAPVRKKATTSRNLVIKQSPTRKVIKRSSIRRINKNAATRKPGRLTLGRKRTGKTIKTAPGRVTITAPSRGTASGLSVGSRYPATISPNGKLPGKGTSYPISIYPGTKTPGSKSPDGRVPGSGGSRNPNTGGSGSPPNTNPQSVPGGTAGTPGGGTWTGPYPITGGGSGPTRPGGGQTGQPPHRNPWPGIGISVLPPDHWWPPGRPHPQRDPDNNSRPPASSYPSKTPERVTRRPSRQRTPPRVRRPRVTPPVELPTRRAAASRESLFRDREVIVMLDNRAGADTARILAVANNLQLRQLTRSNLLGQSMARFTYSDNRRVRAVVRTLRRDVRVKAVQPNFIYRMNPVAKAARPRGLPVAPAAPPPAQMPGNGKTMMNKKQFKHGMSPKNGSPVAPKEGPGIPEVANQNSGAQGAGDKIIEPALAPSKKSWFNPSIQYGLVKVGAARAHTRSTGQRVKIAILDTAIERTHPALRGAIVGSFNALDGKPSVQPLAHGTSIAGIIAGRNRVSGVAPNAQILEVIAFDRASKGRSPESSSFSLLQGIEWAFDQGARVFNMSFSGPHDATLARMINNAYIRGAIMTAAAGNNGAKAAPSFPAAYRNVIAVTATDAQDQLYSKANQGGYVTLAAPGVEILTPSLQGGFAYSSGTSFAAAHVSGVIALLLDIDPSLKEDIVRRAITRSARDLGPDGPDSKFGAGLVDASGAMQQLQSR